MTKPTTTRSLILGVVDNWIRQYGTNPVHETHSSVLDALKKLNLKTCTAKDVDEAIGNKFWTALPKCDECGRDGRITIQLGEPVDYESSTSNICKPCLLKAIELF